MESRKIYPLRNDLVFKLVFGKEGNEEILARLIDALLHFEGDRRIRELTLLNPANLQEWSEDKFTIVDVKASDYAGRRFSIEMQATEKGFFDRRMTYYLAQLYCDQLEKGQGYDELCPAYGIGILDYIMFPHHERMQSRYLFREETAGDELPGLMELHFVELPKYRDRPRGLRSRLEKWLYILRFGEQFVTDEALPEEFESEQELSMAIRELRRFNADDRRRAILEQRERDERDRITDLNVSYRRGREEGREEGRRELAAVVIRLAERKFGSLTSSDRERITDAPESSLREWAENIISAASLEEIFNR